MSADPPQNWNRDEDFFTTEVSMSVAAVIETYVGRWNEETIFQEMRSSLGLETTRGWTEKTVLARRRACSGRTR